MHVFVQLEGADIPKRNPYRHKENMQMPHRKPKPGIKPGNVSLHHCGVQAYTTLYSQAVSHPSINQSRPCSVSKIRSEIRHAQDAVVINQLFHCALFYCNNLSAVLGHIGNCAKLGLYNHTVLNISKLQWEHSNSSGHRSQKLEQAN